MPKGKKKSVLVTYDELVPIPADYSIGPVDYKAGITISADEVQTAMNKGILPTVTANHFNSLSPVEQKEIIDKLATQIAEVFSIMKDKKVGEFIGDKPKATSPTTPPIVEAKKPTSSKDEAAERINKHCEAINFLIKKCKELADEHGLYFRLEEVNMHSLAYEGKGISIDDSYNGLAMGEVDDDDKLTEGLWTSSSDSC